MIAVQEDVIENVIEATTQGESARNSLDELYNRYPQLLAFSQQENFDLLTEEEREILEFSLMVIVEAASLSLAKRPVIDAAMLEKAEEDNWTLRAESESKKFEQVIDQYFEGYRQEDLLAFVEDTLIPDEDSPVTPVGREVIFIACKSVIDAMDRAN